MYNHGEVSGPLGGGRTALVIVANSFALVLFYATLAVAICGVKPSVSLNENLDSEEFKSLLALFSHGLSRRLIVNRSRAGEVGREARETGTIGTGFSLTTLFLKDEIEGESTRNWDCSIESWKDVLIEL